MKWKWKKEVPSLPTTEDAASDDKPAKAMEKEQSDSKKEDQKEQAPLSNYWRILSYGSRMEHGLMLAAFFASSASGVAMPLMQIIFGNLTGTFNSYSVDPTRPQSGFNSDINRYS